MAARNARADPRRQELELYDHTTDEGRLELANQAGNSPDEDASAAPAAGRAPRAARALPAQLADAQQSGLGEYHTLAAQERASSEVYRMNQVEQIVRQLEDQLP